MDDKTIAQLSIQGGNWQQDPVNIRVIEEASHRLRRGRGDLCVLIDSPPDSIIPPGVCEELIDTIRDTYYEMSGSVTRGLRASLLAANTLLFERNLRADSDHRIILGLNCALLRGKDVYIGQLGSALTTVVHEGQVTRYPDNSIWLRNSSPGPFDLKREPPAGLRRDVEPDLFHATLASGDLLLLTTTDLVHLAPKEDLVNAVTYTGGGSVRDGLETLANGRDLSAIIVECPGEQQPIETFKETLVRGGEQPDVSASRQPTEAVSATPVDEEDEGIWEEGTAETYSAVPSPVEDEPSFSEQRAFVDKEAADLPRVGFEDFKENLTRGAKKIRRKAEDLLLRVLPEELPERPKVQRESGPEISLSGRALVIVALVIPLVMLFIVIMTRVQYENTRHERFESVRALVGKLRRRIIHKLDDVDVVERLYHFWKLRDLDHDAVSRTDSSRIVLHGIDIFLLSRGSDRVHKFLLNDVGDALQSADKDSILVQKGDSYGGIELGDMVDIAWMEDGGRRTLSTFVILERAGSLLTYDPQQGIGILPVANSDTWLEPQAIGDYYGNLYVLDPLLGHILKYEPTDNAYTTPPSYYLNPHLDVDLTGAVDMAIDGNVYVLFADGQIQKFYDGEPQPFSMQGLPSPMRSPTTLFVSGSADSEETGGYVYVTDTGNERIIQFNKSGNYIRQFRDTLDGSRMGSLRAVCIDEATGRMFMLNGRTLWLVNIPPFDED